MADLTVSANIDTLMQAANFAAAKTSLGLGTGDSPQFTAVNIGAATDTTVSRTSAGVINVEGKDVYMVGGADVAVADGGTGASTLAAHSVLVGNGTSAVSGVAPGTSGNVLTSDGTDWLSAAPPSGTLPSQTGNSGKYLTTDGSSASWATVSGGTVLVQTQDFRLTTESGVPVSPSNRTAQSTLYFTPANGNQIALYSGSAWVMISSAEVSLALSGLTSGKNYDVFAYNNSGTLTLELSAAWAGDNTPTDSIVLQDGIPCKSGALTRRWIGTIRTTGTTTVEDSEANRFVWNLNNQAQRRLYRTDASSTHSYATGTWRQWNGGTGGPHQVQFVSGNALTIGLGGWVDSKKNASGDTDVCVYDLALNTTTAGGDASITTGWVASGKVGYGAASQSLAGYNYISINEIAFGSGGTGNFYAISVLLFN